MESTTKRLRPYQVRLVTDVCRAVGDILVEQPTGSGKTVQIVTLVAMELGRRFTHAVISAPQEQIEQGFVKRDYEHIAFPDCPGVAVFPFQAPKSLIKGARESSLGAVKRVVQYLRQPGPLDHAFAYCNRPFEHRAGQESSRGEQGSEAARKRSPPPLFLAKASGPGQGDLPATNGRTSISPCRTGRRRIT